MRFLLLLIFFSISSICFGQIRVSSDSSGKNLIVSAPKEYHSQIKKLILSLYLIYKLFLNIYQPIILSRQYELCGHRQQDPILNPHPHSFPCHGVSRVDAQTSC